MSGVVREDDGVDVFLGATEGERDAARSSAAAIGGGGGALAICARLCCILCIVDSLFIRLASVGLIVLAPSPVACVWFGSPGMTDIRLDEAEPLPFAFV